MFVMAMLRKSTLAVSAGRQFETETNCDPDSDFDTWKNA
jgi:hypothetical protein